MNYRILAFAIVKQAILDYETRKAENKSTEEIEAFFLSEWCDYLLTNLKLTGAEILAYLKRN